MTTITPRAVVRRRREDAFIPPAVENHQFGILQELLLQKPLAPKPLTVDRGLLRLPGRLFSGILDFLPLRDRSAVSLMSRGADASRWNACMLTVLPEAYCFYRKILETERPCKKHWDALCEASYNFGRLKIENFSIGLQAITTLSNSQVSIDRSGCLEPIPQFLVREAFPQYSVRGLKALKLVEYLKGGSCELSQNAQSLHSKILQVFCYKLGRGYCSYGMLGQRHFWVIGEEHTGENDEDFFKLALRASENNIALFSENYMASDSEESVDKIKLGIPLRSIFKGLDSLDRNPRLLQVFSHLFLEREFTTKFSPMFFRIFLQCFFASSDNITILYNALMSNIEECPKASLLAQAIFNAINWQSLKDTVLSSEKMDEIYKIAQTDRASLKVFLYIVGKYLAAESDRFTPYQHQIFKEALDNPTPETCLQCEQVFLRKRDAFFAENFLCALPSIPASKPLVAIVGASHQWGFFSSVMSGYYREPQKYAEP